MADIDGVVIPTQNFQPAIGAIMPPPSPQDVLLPIGNVLVMILVVILILVYIYSKVFKKVVNYKKLLIGSFIVIVVILVALFFLLLQNSYNGYY